MAVNMSIDTPILVPVLAALYYVGSHFRGMKIETEIGARRAVREHISEVREMWAVMKDETNRKSRFEKLLDDPRGP